MGYIAHHAIVVTGYGDEVDKARAKAVELFTDIDHPQGNTERLVSPLVQSLTNGYQSFLIAPDGSKEGWVTSESGDDARAAFIDWLRSWSGPDWVLIRFGGDDHDIAYIEAHGAWGAAERRAEEDRP